MQRRISDTAMKCLAAALLLSAMLGSTDVTAQPPARKAKGPVIENLRFVAGLSDWASRLNGHFDEAVASERNAQTLRALGELRADLSLLENDARALLGSITEERPRGEAHARLGQRIKDLRKIVGRVEASSRTVRTTIHLRDRRFGLDTESPAFRGQGRADSLESFLQGSRQWNPDFLRLSLNNGVIAVHEAQSALTELQKKMDPSGRSLAAK